MQVPLSAADGATGKMTAAWTPAADMRVARATAAAASPLIGPWAGLVVVAGGQTGAGGKVTGSVELYDPAADSWVDGPSLLVPRQGHVMWAEPDGSVVVAGGRDAAGAYLSSCERLDAGPGTAKTSRWLPAGDLPKARFRAAAVCVPAAALVS